MCSITDYSINNDNDNNNELKQMIKTNNMQIIKKTEKPYAVQF